jgi:hypothetical protein
MDMAITEGPGGTPADLAATVWDLAGGFAILARIGAQGATRNQSIDLLKVTDRLHRRALLLDREEVADHLAEAMERLRLSAE